MTTILVEDFTDVLRELATGTYDIQPGVPAVDDGSGGAVPGPPAELVRDVLCSVQPLDADTVMPESGGNRLDSHRTVFSAYRLQPADTRTGRGGDIIFIDSATNGPGTEAFVVATANAWGLASNVTQATVTRVER